MTAPLNKVALHRSRGLLEFTEETFKQIKLSDFRKTLKAWAEKMKQGDRYTPSNQVENLMKQVSLREGMKKKVQSRFARLIENIRFLWAKFWKTFSNRSDSVFNRLKPVESRASEASRLARQGEHPDIIPDLHAQTSVETLTEEGIKALRASVKETIEAIEKTPDSAYQELQNLLATNYRAVSPNPPIKDRETYIQAAKRLLQNYHDNLQADGNLFSILTRLARVHYHKGTLEEAKKHFEKAIAIPLQDLKHDARKYGDVYEWLAQISKELGESIDSRAQHYTNSLRFQLEDIMQIKARNTVEGNVKDLYVVSDLMDYRDQLTTFYRNMSANLGENHPALKSVKEVLGSMEGGHSVDDSWHQIEQTLKALQA